MSIGVSSTQDHQRKELYCRYNFGNAIKINCGKENKRDIDNKEDFYIQLVQNLRNLTVHW